MLLIMINLFDSTTSNIFWLLVIAWCWTKLVSGPVYNNIKREYERYSEREDISIWMGEVWVNLFTMLYQQQLNLYFSSEDWGACKDSQMEKIQLDERLIGKTENS